VLFLFCSALGTWMRRGGKENSTPMGGLGLQYRSHLHIISTVGKRWISPGSGIHELVSSRSSTSRCQDHAKKQALLPRLFTKFIFTAHLLHHDDSFRISSCPTSCICGGLCPAHPKKLNEELRSLHVWHR
jgi:hypothetical protein